MATATTARSKANTAKTKTEGAIKAGGGKYQFDLARVRKVDVGTGYWSAHGIIGMAVDGTMSGPAYMKGHEPKVRK